MCLKKVCTGHKYVKDCSNASSELKSKLLMEWYYKLKAEREEKRKMKRQISMMLETSNCNSSLFTCIFCDSIEAIVMADNGSDDNLIPPHMLRAMFRADTSTMVVDLNAQVEFKMAVNAKPGQEHYTVLCSQSVNASVRLTIRHRTSLLLQTSLGLSLGNLVIPYS